MDNLRYAHCKITEFESLDVLPVTLSTSSTAIYISFTELQ